MERPKKGFNFEFRPLDRDSFTQNMGSITESTLEGSLLAQNIPLAKPNTAVKMPLIFKENEGVIYKIKNKDTGI